MKRRTRIEKLAETFRRGFDLPAGGLSAAAGITLTGNTQAVIEGCLGVLEYGSELLAFNTGQLIVRLRGAGLTIVSFQGGIVTVNGTIAAVEFGT